MTNLKFKGTITYNLKLLSLIKRLQTTSISLLLIAALLKTEDQGFAKVTCIAIQLLETTHV
jgi:hypothetical protein